MVFGLSIGVDEREPSRLERRAKEGDSPVGMRSRDVALAAHESGSLGIESKAGGILLLSLNIDRSPIENK